MQPVDHDLRCPPALAALYRVWDGIDHHLHPSGRPPAHRDDNTSTSDLVRLPAADLTILHAAAAALDRPIAELASLLARTDPAGRAIRALTALLWTLDSLSPGNAHDQSRPRRHRALISLGREPQPAGVMP